MKDDIDKILDPLILNLAKIWVANNVPDKRLNYLFWEIKNEIADQRNKQKYNKKLNKNIS
jgi:hypothetical protein